MNNIRLLPACVLCWLVIGAGWCPAAVTSFFTVTTPGSVSRAALSNCRFAGRRLQ